MPCLHPVSHFIYKRKQKRALTPTPGSLLVNETLINNYTLTSNIPIQDMSRNRSERAIGLAAIASAAFACPREIGNFGHRGVRSLSSEEEK